MELLSRNYGRAPLKRNYKEITPPLFLKANKYNFFVDICRGTRSIYTPDEFWLFPHGEKTLEF